MKSRPTTLICYVLLCVLVPHGMEAKEAQSAQKNKFGRAVTCMQGAALGVVGIAVLVVTGIVVSRMIQDLACKPERMAELERGLLEQGILPSSISARPIVSTRGTVRNEVRYITEKFIVDQEQVGRLVNEFLYMKQVNGWNVAIQSLGGAAIGLLFSYIGFSRLYRGWCAWDCEDFSEHIGR